MKNHFIMSYAGNKREEVINIYETINFKNITTIIEPFCGSCALSYYISTQQPKKFKYVLNDNNQHLISLLKICSIPKELQIFEEKINEVAKSLISKAIYLEVIKENTIIAWFIKNKIFTMRAGLFPLKYEYKYINIKDCPIIKFLQNEDITLTNECAMVCFKKYISEENFLFFDPPYLDSCNAFYLNTNVNIYEYFNNNNIKNFECKILLCLESNWIIQLLFKETIKDNNKLTYEKMYQMSKRKTKHIIITNFKNEEKKLLLK